MNPFKIEGPAVVSFSGGRTSGLMLRKILDAGLGHDVHVLFANTGKERQETLDFVHEVETRWSVRIWWLERAVVGERFLKNGKKRLVIRANETSFDRAARAGEPFLTLIRNRNFLPNPVTRFCTQELKIRAMKQWMISMGYRRWTNVVGLRFDEPGRVARQRAQNERKGQRWEVACPLFDAGLTVANVDAFWKAQPFDLKLRPWEGNCDLCFLKGLNRKLRVIRDRPERAKWWIEAEAEAESRSSKPSGSRFRNDQPSYAAMLKMVESQPLLPFEGEEHVRDDSLDCFCTG